ncbi:hypothetical protein [Desulfovibrio sp. ZJ200]|uniref:hypothetical protein n=1 Tax=Desulfovibrio sp. ZJ200 TaxID=2709792 RepID=UPI0013EA2430|nr:hypothetical protein [Desulfovibrio sp. ZJ200]
MDIFNQKILQGSGHLPVMAGAMILRLGWPDRGFCAPRPGKTQGQAFGNLPKNALLNSA